MASSRERVGTHRNLTEITETNYSLHIIGLINNVFHLNIQGFC